MSDEPSAGAPGAPSSVDAVPAAGSVPQITTDPHVDLHSRIERRMWLLHKGTDRAEGRASIKFGRREFRVYVNGGLLWSRNYALDETTQFDVDAAAKHAEFVALGWAPPGETPPAE